MIDAISLAETEIRANAFRASYAAKAAFYQQGLISDFIGSDGMVIAGLDSNDVAIPDGSSALMDRHLSYTQALRFDLTGEAEALDNIRRSLPAVLTLMDITGNPRTFARTLRPAGPPLNRSLESWYWEFCSSRLHSGGNNDTSKGLLLGMIAGWQVLPNNDPLRNEIRTHALALLELCTFLEDPPSECGSDDSGGFNLPSTNPGTAQLLAGITNNNLSLIAEGLLSLRDPWIIKLCRSR